MERFLFLANAINSDVDQNRISFFRIYVYVDLETDAGDIKRQMIYGQV